MPCKVKNCLMPLRPTGASDRTRLSFCGTHGNQKEGMPVKDPFKNLSKRKKRIPDPFDGAKGIAHFEFMWEGCRHRACTKRKRCTGGPRGTKRKYGIPFCKLDGNYVKPVWRQDPIKEPVGFRAKRI